MDTTGGWSVLTLGQLTGGSAPRATGEWRVEKDAERQRGYHNPMHLSMQEACCTRLLCDQRTIVQDQQ